MERITDFGRRNGSQWRYANLTVRNTIIYFLERRKISLSCRHTLVQYSYSFKHEVFLINESPVITVSYSPSSVIVPLLEPLLLACLWEEETEDSAFWTLGDGEGDGEGVRVGDVLLDVDEVPDGGLLFISSFCCS